MIQVQVAGMMLDRQSRQPILLLRVPPLDRFLPIWIGPNEAESIAMALKKERFERPLTHDLLVTIVDGLEGLVSRVVIHDLREGTFFAKIFLARQQQVIAVDARPSDSIAVALRTGAPIFVARSVLEREENQLLALDPEVAQRLFDGMQEGTGPGSSEPNRDEDREEEP